MAENVRIVLLLMVKIVKNINILLKTTQPVTEIISLTAVIEHLRRKLLKVESNIHHHLESDLASQLVMCYCPRQADGFQLLVDSGS